ncbi:uncharacterized protein LOC142330036 [Lycorma delicatula]|uniref:uncharacterized protein LOC142330036 n=1 Tax=Lycorma delicatula TaxID=130591 RepID=UPI003F50FE28
MWYVELDDDPLKIDNENQEKTHDNDDVATVTDSNGFSAVKEENVDYELDCSGSHIDESSERQEKKLRLFKCKICQQPYEMICGSNLIIRGFCQNCLYSDKNKDNTNNDNTAQTTFSAISKVSITPSNLMPEEKEVDSELSLENFRINRSEANDCITEEKSIEHELSIRNCDTINDCIYCNKNFSEVSMLKEHLKIREKDKNICIQCNKMFCNSIDFSKHIKSHNEEKFTTAVTGSSTVVDECNDAFDEIVKETSDLEVLLNKNIVDNSSIRKEKGSREQLNYRCGLCTKSIPKMLYNSHLDSHNENTDSSIALLHRSSSRSSNTSSCRSSLVTQEDFMVKSLNKHLKKASASSVFELQQEEQSDDVKPVVISVCKYEYSCKSCNLEFINFNLLNDHLLTDQHVNMVVSITGNNLFCKTCENTFFDICEFKKHVSTKKHIVDYHIQKYNIPVYSCKSCSLNFVKEDDLKTHELLSLHNLNNNKIFTNNVLKAEINVNSNVYKCNTCNKAFSKLSSLKKHASLINHEAFDSDNTIANQNQLLKQSIKEVEKKNSRFCLYCKICSKNFKSRKNLNRHYMFFHRNRNFSDLPGKNLSEFKTDNIKSTIELFQCKTCNRTFDNISSLKTHCTALNHDFNGNGRIIKTNDISKVNYLCKHCNKRFDNKNSLSLHIKRQINCSKFYNKYKNLKIHNGKMIKLEVDKLIVGNSTVNNKNNEVVTSNNDICNINISTKVNKNYKTFGNCSSCTEEFSDDKDFIFHSCMLSHNLDFKIDLCCDCKKVFMTLSEFFDHLNSKKSYDTHNMVFDQAKFFCKLCNASFTTVYCLRRHSLTKRHIGLYAIKIYKYNLKNSSQSQNS